ncbi:MAG: hypothetical protein Q9186_003475 [Xanthomendoza sp. 1 TL-2023]
MSPARNEADTGPELQTKDTDLYLEYQEEDEEKETQETEIGKGAGSFRDNEEETSDPVVPNAEHRDEPQPDPLYLSDHPSSPNVAGRPSSADGSLSIPDDTPSLQNSLISSTGRRARLSPHGRSPTPSLRPFDRRFQAPISSSPRGSSRAVSPAFLQSHSRQTSVNSLFLPNAQEVEPDDPPWEVVRWTKLRKITGHALSEIGKRNFGRPVCITISTSIALGTSKGIILIFDYNQNLKSIIGPGTQAVESGAVTSISIAADHSTVAGGHASGHIFTWELAKPAKPFLHIPPVDRKRTPDADGHTTNVAILHLGFLGMRHTALVSADDKGMAFSHIATRGMGSVTRSVKTTRILGRYQEGTPSLMRQRKPSSVLAFSPLPIGNADHPSDTMGLVAMLTPYLLVIVSTTPIAQTQYKTPRPKEVAAHSAMTAALAWFPSVKLKVPNVVTSESVSRVKLVYCWSNVLTVLEVTEAAPSVSNGAEEPLNLQFRSRSRWKAQEGIVAVQWLGRSVLAVLTITQQLVILEDSSLRETNSSDLIQKHIYHVDLFSQQLTMLVEHLDEEDASMHGVVADAFYMSFRAYKGRLFLLGFNEVTFGTLSNWADRLLALMEEGNHIGAIALATSYYTGEADKVSVGLPDDDSSRHRMVRDKLLEMISASLRFTFGEPASRSHDAPGLVQVQELAGVCISACVSIEETDYLFEDVYTPFLESDTWDVFMEAMESFIMDDHLKVIPPSVLKDLVRHYTDRALHSRLEELLCHLDSRTMDLDQITWLCKHFHLYDALLYVWNQALGDYTTILSDLLSLATDQGQSDPDTETLATVRNTSSASKIFPYMSYILTGRIYPTGKEVEEGRDASAKAEIYHFLFSGGSGTVSNGDHSMLPYRGKGDTSFSNLRKVLDFDASSFLSMLNEAFEDPFLNGGHDNITKDTQTNPTDAQKFGLSMNRQGIVSILLDVMVPPRYEAEDTVYLSMFIARNLPKFPQFILLPGHMLHRVLTSLCEYAVEDVAEDCQLSVEYLLSVYQPPDLQSLVPLLSNAGFYRVLRSVYRTERQYANLVQTCFDEGPANGSIVFDCVAECFRASTGLNEKQMEDVQNVIKENASHFVNRDAKAAAATIEQFAASLHEDMLKALSELSDDGRELDYLQTILDPPDRTTEQHRSFVNYPNKTFIELYVRLLCEHNPHHVNGYVDGLKAGDLRLEEVLPALENSGVVDAAVILMAREGQVRDAMSRLAQHLGTLEAALLGLLDAAGESPDIENTAEAAQDLVASIQKFTRVGIWLCQGQTKAAQQSRSRVKKLKRAKGSDEDLSTSEGLWLDLIDAVVQLAKHVTETPRADFSSDEADGKDTSSKGPQQPFDTSKVVVELRTIVQETFTALLSATSVPRGHESLGANVSFLRILRNFLSRASASSPSLSNLRTVLSTIFSAYSYEERLLDLANRLLDKDLFVHVAEADTLRRRGWRPLGQVCEGCSQRVWGPGTGGYAWDAWAKKEAEDEETQQQEDKSQAAVMQSSKSAGHGKGKAIQEEAQHGSAVGGYGPRGKQTISSAFQNDEYREGAMGSGALIIFSCRHIFHRMCLETMQDPGDAARSRQDVAADRPMGFSFISVLLFLGLVPFTLARYSVQDDYSGDKFLDMFSFDTMDDPTHGYVNYVDQSQARSNGLLDTNNGAVILRVDSTNVASGRGRNSLRLTSKAKYNHGLVVVDLAHMPGNACGVWPAFWMVGPNWPASGEIDILEGVNLQSENQMTMHTNEGCSLAGSSCLSNQGCSAKGGAFGDGFNQNNGGIYATEWTNDAIKIWFFPRGQQPNDILSDSPDPTKWGNPTSTFQGGSNCDIDSHFKDQQIVFDTTFCGDWAGSVWSQDPTCSAKASSCQDFVQNNPKAFSEAYWTINALKVYAFDGSATDDSASSPKPPKEPLGEEPSSPAVVPQPSSTTTTMVSTSSVPTMTTSYIDGGKTTVTVDDDLTFLVTKSMAAAVKETLAPGESWQQDQPAQQQEGGGYGVDGNNGKWGWSGEEEVEAGEGKEWKKRGLRARRYKN